MMYISKWINLWVLLFSITVLSYSGHGGQSAIILLLTMLFISTTKNKESSEFALRKEEKLFVYLVLIFFGLQLFGVFYQPEGYEFESVRRQLRALDQPTRWLLLLPVFFLFRRYIINWKLVAIGLSIGTLVSVTIAHHQVYYLGIDRAFSVFGNPIPFGELMVVVDLILWMFMNHAWNKGDKYLSTFFLVASLAAFYGSLLAITRGAWLVYVFMILIFLVYVVKKSLFNYKYLFSNLVLIRLLFAVVIFFIVNQTEQFQKLKNKTVRVVDNLSQLEFEKSAEGRAEVFKVSYLIIKDHPFGVGTDNFKNVNKKYRERKGDDYRNHAHNEFINLMVENGIQGALVLILLLGVAFKVFWNNLNSSNDLARIYASCGILLIVSYVIFGQTQAIFSHHSTLIFFIFYLYFFFAQIQILSIKKIFYNA